MKKLTLLLLAALITFNLFSQAVIKSQNNKLYHKLDAIKAMPAKELTDEIIINKVIPYQKSVAVTDTAFYLKPEGSFYGGFFANGYYTYPRIFAPVAESMTFQNVSTTPSGSTWSVNETSAATTDDFETSYGFGAYYLPTLKTAKGSSYMYGKIYSDYAAVLSGADYALPMTTCTMYTSATYASTGSDCYRVGAGSYGNYAYGTDLVINNKSLDTIGVVFNNISIMYVDSVILPIYNNTTTGTLIPSGATLKLTAYKINSTENGLEITNNILATATATSSNITDKYVDSSSQVDMLAFVFKSTNALGISAPKPVAFDGPFYLELTGYNESNCNFGILSDYYSPTNGSTYFTYKGYLSQVWDRGGNIAMSLNAILPAMIPDTTDMNYTIATGGGEAVNNSNYYPGLYATFAPADELGGWTLDGMPEWLSLSYNNSYFADYNYIGLEFNADALPAGTTGRSANVTITSLGKSVIYTISQGSVTGVNDVKVSNINVFKTTDAFVINKAENYNSVSLMSISGQLINNYRIANGSVTVPTSALTNGVYLLRFNGNSSETIKVVK